MIAINMNMPAGCDECPFARGRTFVCTLSEQHRGGWRRQIDPGCPLRPVERVKVARFIRSPEFERSQGYAGYADYVEQRTPHELANAICEKLLEEHVISITSERMNEVHERHTAELLVVRPDEPEGQIVLDNLKYS